MAGTILFPVAGIILCPLFVIVRVNFAVLGIRATFFLLPGPATLTLALMGRAVGLITGLRARLKLLAACCTMLGSHDVLHMVKNMERA
ncbi:MAG: hypothetical protein D4S02_09730 [Rhodocyclaceae bacterium]|nr:MAG: hypothetical protein D4S02_09730 [Rhodocyclaceae bacterium]